MDLNQRKLNKSEWESIEIPLPKKEIDILNLIIRGFYDVNIKINHNISILSFLKLEYSEKMEYYIYNRYLRKNVETIERKLCDKFADYKIMKIDINVTPNSIDKLRIDRFNDNDFKNIDIYEFLLIKHTDKLVKYSFGKKQNIKLFHYHYFTLYKLIKNNIINLNKHIKNLVNEILKKFEPEINISTIIENASEFIEYNENILKYEDLALYQHQKEIFTLIKSDVPKLILYMAPTGTGKTLTPIAISEQKKIIFVCAARHVGLALARASISVGKKIAFAFGCSSASDIRLHYFAAKEYDIDKKSGGIKKVKNDVGDNVEIIISDVKSYLPAMYYMLAFFQAENIVTYWDEPTITMDYKDHDFHPIIHENWSKNIIPNVVLSSATLPKENELTETIPDFLNKFAGSQIYNIVSNDCKKSIPIINKDGFVVLPHFMSDDYNEIVKIANHCNDYLTLLRYFDLSEVTKFITFINKNNYTNNKMSLDRHFENLDDVNMTNIKIYYIQLLKNINPAFWDIILHYLKENKKPRIIENNTVDTKGDKIKKIHSIGPVTNISKNKLEGAPISRLSSEQITKTNTNITSTISSQTNGTSGIYVTTKDAYTLTDGPTIFITNDIEKIAKFCVQQANIPNIVMEQIMEKIEYNNIINKQIQELDDELEDIKNDLEKQVKNKVNEIHSGSRITGRVKSNKDPKKINRDIPDEIQNKNSTHKLTEKINMLRSMIKIASLNDTFIPNKRSHLEKWAPNDVNTSNTFTSNIDEQIVTDIMTLNCVDNLWKVLLMMGIGVFINHENITYTEIMKKLADEQKLYIIIASSDYIYGTNYQFCHGLLSKDLDLTQEKIIQAMGRIGRNNIQQNYTIRFRDNSQIFKLFTNETEKPEIINMNKLFNSEM